MGLPVKSFSCCSPWSWVWKNVISTDISGTLFGESQTMRTSGGWQVEGQTWGSPGQTGDLMERATWRGSPAAVWRTAQPHGLADRLPLLLLSGTWKNLLPFHTYWKRQKPEPEFQFKLNHTISLLWNRNICYLIKSHWWPYVFIKYVQKNLFCWLQAAPSCVHSENYPQTDVEYFFSAKAKLR